MAAFNKISVLTKSLCCGAAIISSFFCNFSYAQPQQSSRYTETTTTVIVTAKDGYGKESKDNIVVTIFKPTSGEGPFPAIVVNHGRPDDALRATMVRTRFSNISPYLIDKGFVVIVPTRLGYGNQTASGDPEQFGFCNNPVFQAAFEAVASQVLGVVDVVKTLPYVIPDQIFLIGGSVGGMGVVAAAATNPSSVRAVVNFAGGHGGRPGKPDQPCSAYQLERAAKAFGQRKSQVPSLWIYNENDQLFSPKLATDWFGAFSEAGGKGEFRMMPAYGKDGHDYFEKAPQLWGDIILDFFSRNGLRMSKAGRSSEIEIPQASNFAALDNFDALPKRTPKMLLDYRRYLVYLKPKAFAIDATSGAHGVATGPNAISEALDLCKNNSATTCKLYAVNDDVVWKP
jgi:dienelactone hydrolase